MWLEETGKSVTNSRKGSVILKALVFYLKRVILGWVNLLFQILSTKTLQAL